MVLQTAEEFEDDFPLWEFSLAYYARPGVASALLDLQDRLDADVNIVLFGLWRARDRRVLTDEDYAVLDTRISGWRHEMVRPARRLRRAVKLLDREENQPLYREAKALELKLERLQQRHMQNAAHLAPGLAAADVREAAMKNLAAYGTLLGHPLDEDASRFLSRNVEEMAA